MSNTVNKQALVNDLLEEMMIYDEEGGFDKGARYIASKYVSAINSNKYDTPSPIQGYREALEAIGEELTDDTSVRAQRINRIINDALSLPDMQPGVADKVREMYQVWMEHEGPAIFSGETIANAIADVAILVGISIPGIDPDDPRNVPGFNSTEDQANG